MLKKRAGVEIVPFEVERNLRLSPFWVESIRGWVPVRVESFLGWVHSGLSPIGVESFRSWVHKGLSPFRVESFRGWVHSGLSLFGVGSIQGWVFLGSVMLGSVIQGSVGESILQLWTFYKYFVLSCVLYLVCCPVISFNNVLLKGRRGPPLFGAGYTLIHCLKLTQNYLSPPEIDWKYNFCSRAISLSFVENSRQVNI
jgi:hypothetical protein